jgi:cullin-associated NEDD8-dissociated protein 1
MQLFTVGLFKLNQDGTQLDGTQTYDNDDIMSFSRVWTGFERRPARGNVAQETGNGASNEIDPMIIDETKRDVFPKSNILGGYLGDGYALCEELAPDFFLREGARYSYLGRNPRPKHFSEKSSYETWDVDEIFLLSPSSSLYDAICSPDADGICSFKSEVYLPSSLTCYGDECEIDQPRVVRLNVASAADPSSFYNVYYEFVRPPCVELAFFNDAKLLTDHNGYDTTKWSVCANPNLPTASPACAIGLDQPSGSNAWGGTPTKFYGERMK